MSDRHAHLAEAIAGALLAGSWTRSHMSLRVRTTLGMRKTPAWVAGVVAEVAVAYRDAPRDRPRELAAFVTTTQAWRRHRPHLHRVRVRVRTPVPTAVVERRWPVADLPDLSALATLLGVDQGELAWFADLRGWERHCAPRLRHYTWREVPKRGGGTRLVAAPKPWMKDVQRRLLREVIGPIPLHDAAHGGVPGRSVRTAVAPHAGAAVVLHFDLVAFFPSIPAGRVYGVLRTAGLPEQVAHTITGIVTTVAPYEVSRELRTPHLPQGAPTSPRLADLVTFTLDRRLSGLAAAFGARYTRYADDLTFSGGRSLHAARSRFTEAVDTIVRDEGFRLNERKSVVLGDAGAPAGAGGGRQHPPRRAAHRTRRPARAVAQLRRARMGLAGPRPGTGRVPRVSHRAGRLDRRPPPAARPAAGRDRATHRLDGLTGAVRRVTPTGRHGRSMLRPPFTRADLSGSRPGTARRDVPSRRRPRCRVRGTSSRPGRTR